MGFREVNVVDEVIKIILIKSVSPEMCYLRKKYVKQLILLKSDIIQRQFFFVPELRELGEERKKKLAS